MGRWPMLLEVALSQQKLRKRQIAPLSLEGNSTLSKFDEARRNSAAVNPNRPPERSWEPSMQTVEGVIASLAGTKMSMKNREENLVSFTLAEDATFTCDGEVCQVSDLAIGNRIRVTVAKGDRTIAVGIESLKQHKHFKKPE